MSETIALTRLAISRSRNIMVGLIGVAVIGISIGASFEFTFHDPSRTDLPWLSVFIFWSSMPAGFATFVLFDFGSGHGINLTESNVDRWILGSPIRSWKIAIVPLVLKTAWISVFWLIVVMFLRYADVEAIPKLIPCIALSSVVIWAMAIAWRPMHWGWLRFILLFLAEVSTIAVFIVFLNADNLQFPPWEPASIRSLALWSSQAYLIINFAIAIFASVRAVEIARTSPDGIVPSHTRNSNRGIASGWERWIDRRRNFASPIRALAWYEFATARNLVLRQLAWLVIPSILLLGLAFPFNGVTITLALVAFASWATVAGHTAGLTENQGESRLSTMLTRMPLSNAQIAWTRLAVSLAIMATVYSCIVLVFAGWSLWPPNREVWMDWAAGLAAAPSPIPAGASIALSGSGTSQNEFVTGSLRIHLHLGVCDHTDDGCVGRNDLDFGIWPRLGQPRRDRGPVFDRSGAGRFIFPMVHTSIRMAIDDRIVA